MSRNLALEKVGRARVAYKLQQMGWLVGEAFDDGYDLLEVFPRLNHHCRVELKTIFLTIDHPSQTLQHPYHKRNENYVHI